MSSYTSNHMPEHNLTDKGEKRNDGFRIGKEEAAQLKLETVFWQLSFFLIIEV